MIRTVSPRSKSPSTARIPAGSRLLPFLTSARSAPESMIRRPAAVVPPKIQRLRLSNGVSNAGKWVPIFSPLMTMRVMTSGARPAAITTSAPARRATSAAWSLVDMPPTPNPLILPPASRRSVSSIVRTSGMIWASGSVRGSAVNRPGWSVSKSNRSASASNTASADRLSLSPTLISAVATASFSLMMGIMRYPSSACNISCAFK